MSTRIPRRTYADLYGPTTGDRVSLADTELIVEVEQDYAVYGERSLSVEARSSATEWDKAPPPSASASMARSTW